MDRGYLWEIIKRIDFYIRLADQKANYLLALHVAFSSFVFSQTIEFVRFLILVLAYYKHIFYCRHCIFLWFVTFALLLFLFSLIKFFYYFYKVISPRLKMDGYMYKYSSLIFWDTASSLDFNAFDRKIRNERFVEVDAIKQIYVNSRIASEKFHYVRKAYGLNLWIFLASGLFLIMVKFLLF